MSGNHYLPALPRLTIGRDHWTWTDGPRSATWTGSPEDRVAGLTSCSASIDAKRPIVLLLHHSLCCTCPIVAGDTPRTRDEARFRLESNSPHDAETLYCDWHDGKHGGLILGGDRTAVDEAIAAIERCRGRVIACTAEALFDVDVHRPDSTGAFVHRLAMADDSLQVVAMMDGVPLAWFSGRDEPPQRSLLDAAARALLPRGVDKNAPSVDRSATGIVGMHRNADRAMFDLRRDERWSGQSPRKGPALEFVGAIFVCLSLLSSAAYLTIAARAAVNAADRARSAADELAILRIGTADDAMALRRLRNRLSTMQRFAELERLLVPQQHPLRLVCDVADAVPAESPLRLKRLLAGPGGFELEVDDAAPGTGISLEAGLRRRGFVPEVISQNPLRLRGGPIAGEESRTP